MSVHAPATCPAHVRTVPVIAAFALAVVLGIGGLALLPLLGAPQGWVDGGFWAVGIALAAALALASARRPGFVGSVLGGLAGAATVVSAAFFLGIGGAIFAGGHDGLAFALGLGAGCLLLQLTIAPRLAQIGAQTGATSLYELFAVRYPGLGPRLACACVVAVSMLALLAAELMAAGVIGSRLLGVGYGMATMVAACAVFACFIVRGAGASWVNGLLFPLLIIALLVPLVQLSASWYGLPLPQVAYANALWQLQGLEETLLEQELADPAFMRPMLTAFLSLTPTNFLGIVLGLAAGVAALPSLIATQLGAVRSARGARWSAVWMLIFVVLLLSLVPAVAAYAKLSLVTLISERTPIADLPAWIFTYGKLGLVQVCGQAATDAAAIAQACAALPDAAPVLRLQDVTLNPDIVTLALPEITGLTGPALGFIAAAGLATALATAHGPLRAVVGAVSGGESIAPGGPSPRVPRLLSYGVAALVLCAAAFAAQVRPAGILEVATWGFVLAAGGLFPALLAALWWPRATSAGAVAAMLAGFAVTLVYLLGPHYFAVPFFEATSALSAGGQSGQEYFAELKDAWLAADPGAAQDAAWTALDAHARSVADWWGISNLAVALLALPAGIVALVVVSLVTRAPPRGRATTP